MREVDPRLPVLSTGVCVQVNIKDDADEDLVEYINTLRVSILEAYTGIMQGLREAMKQEMVLPAIDAIRDLLQVMILPLLPLMAFLWVWPPHALSASPAPLSLSLSLSLSPRHPHRTQRSSADDHKSEECIKAAVGLLGDLGQVTPRPPPSLRRPHDPTSLTPPPPSVRVLACRHSARVCRPSTSCPSCRA